MSTYHTFFVTTEAQLDELFPGWTPTRRVDVLPLTLHRIDPVTQKPMRVELPTHHYEPVGALAPLGSPSLFDDLWGAPLAPILVANEYMASVEATRPPGLRSLPHFCSKNVDPLLDFDPFVKILLGADAAAPPARMGTLDDLRSDVHALPEAATTRLIQLEATTMREVATRLVSVEPTGEWTLDEVDSLVEHVLSPLRELAREAATRGGRVYQFWTRS